MEFLNSLIPTRYFCVFEIPRVPFAFEFESEWPNGNLATKQLSNCLPFVTFGLSQLILNDFSELPFGSSG